MVAMIVKRFGQLLNKPPPKTIDIDRLSGDNHRAGGQAQERQWPLPAAAAF